MDTYKTITLHSGETLVTDEEGLVYQVRSGRVRVFIAPLVNEETQRRVLLCVLEAGRSIPSLVYRDQNYRHWRFVLDAAEDSELALRPDSITSVLQKKFAASAGLESFLSGKEKFEDSLVDYYEHESVKDGVFIKRGLSNEPEAQTAAFGEIAGVFTGKGVRIEGDDPVYRAAAYICMAMGQKIAPYDRIVSACGKGIPGIADVARISHFICREIVLDSGWYHKDVGPIVGSLDGKTIACVPRGRNRYWLYDPETQERKKLTKEIAESISPKAHVLEPTLPNHSLSRKDLISFGWKCLPKEDLWMMILLGLLCTLVGVLLPTLNQKIYDDYIPLGNTGQLVQICIVIGAFMVGNLFFSMVKSIAEFRAQTHVGYTFQDALYYRILRLPESFFRDFESADLGQRLMQIGETVNQLIASTLVAGLSTLFSILYLARMFHYSSSLSWVSLLMVLVYAAVIAGITLSTIKLERSEAEDRGSASSKLYQYLNGIEKIRMAGVEDRAAYEYLVPFADVQTAEIKKNRRLSAGAALQGAATTIFSMVLYLLIVHSKLNISMGAFIGFNTALGTFTASVLDLITNLIGVYQMKPTFERIQPILKAESEDSTENDLPGDLTGEIDIEHVSFRYEEGRPLVLDDLSLHIRKGEYLGIVGSSGCGKSTLLKLLLGFEAPITGQICYDGKDLKKLDKQSFRQHLGVVLQGGKLISGSIFENITITAPEATMKDVQQVVEEVGLKDDIAQMPMGLHTVLSETSGTISGGQQQRILIARAIIRRPSILIFDEATSALDNVTQAAVTESLDKMNATRIVVAHRLSTIRGCDRIIVLDRGHIVEEGSFESLMENKGLFYQLASRQIAE